LVHLSLNCGRYKADKLAGTYCYVIGLAGLLGAMELTRGRYANTILA
jgi:hypothetical protein